MLQAIAIVRVHNSAGNVIETHERGGVFKNFIITFGRLWRASTVGFSRIG